MSFTTEIQEALARNASDNELVQLIVNHRDEGLSQQEAYDVLRALRGPMRDQLGEHVEDRILELMDIVTGFCHPDHRLWRKQLRT